MRGKCQFLAGIIVGGILFSGGAAFAAGILAEHAPQTAYVDGAPVQLEAYNIGGYNYVKLRDIGQAVGFNVYWDGQSVQMDSDAPYTGEAPTQTVSSIRVDSRKGTSLTVGERSTLLTEPRSATDTAVSSNPAVVSVEDVSGYWVAVARAEGSAVITVSNSSGGMGQISFTVKAKSPSELALDLSANMEIRLEMVRLINEVRRENGVAELPVNEALMNAAQAISIKGYTKHNNKEECETAMFYGYPHGFASNLTMFSGAETDTIAQQAVNNWVNSPGHFQAMIDPRCDSIGVGVTLNGRTAYCQMFAGDSNSHHPYE